MWRHRRGSSGCVFIWHTTTRIYTICTTKRIKIGTPRRHWHIVQSADNFVELSRTENKHFVGPRSSALLKSFRLLVLKSCTLFEILFSYTYFSDQLINWPTSWISDQNACLRFTVSWKQKFRIVKFSNIFTECVLFLEGTVLAGGTR